MHARPPRSRNRNGKGDAWEIHRESDACTPDLLVRVIALEPERDRRVERRHRHVQQAHHQRQQQHAPPPSGRLSRATLRPGGVRARARRAVFASRDDLAALVSEFSYGKLSELAAAARALARYVDDLETELEAADDAVPP